MLEEIGLAFIEINQDHLLKGCFDLIFLEIRIVDNYFKSDYSILISKNRISFYNTNL